MCMSVNFRQTFKYDALRGIDELVGLWVQNVKVEYNGRTKYAGK